MLALRERMPFGGQANALTSLNNDEIQSRRAGGNPVATTPSVTADALAV